MSNLTSLMASAPFFSLLSRECIRFYRQRSRMIASLITPVLFWLFLGGGIGSAFPTPTQSVAKSYLEIFYPGFLLMTVLFTSIFSVVSVIEDRHQGFLQSVVVSPVSNLSIVGAKVGGGSLISLFQAIAFLLIAPLVGFSLSFPSACLVLLSLFVSSFTLTAISFLFVWKMDSIQGFHSIMNLVLFPMWFLSGSFFPAQTAPVVLKPLMYLNPLTYGLSAVKQAMYWNQPEFVTQEAGFIASYPTSLLYCGLIGVVFYALAMKLVSRSR